MRQLLITTLFVLAACGSKSKPAAEPPATTPPGSATEPTAGSDATPAPTANKCVQSGGKCTNKLATVACSKFEEGPEWGCGENNGCCL